MNNQNYDAGHQLLRDLEARSGALSLHVAGCSPGLPAEAWKNAVYGDWLAEWEQMAIAGVEIDMFEGPLQRMMLNACGSLSPKLARAVKSVPVGMTSIPVLNACAVKRNYAIAIAFNQRLCTVLPAVNAIYWDRNAADAANDEQMREYHDKRLNELLIASSQDRFDLAMEIAAPYPSLLHFRIGVAFANVQLAFVMLHEFGHVCLGHLDRETLWIDHPLSDEKFLYFNSSQKAEFEADEFAINAMFSISGRKWKRLVKLLGMPEHDDDIARKTFFKLILRLFSWFCTMVEEDVEGYYKVPRSHPHPLDRMNAMAERYVKLP
jgi:hypothetical protein